MVPPRSFDGLFDLFIKHQLIDTDIAIKAMADSARLKKPFLSYLVEEKLIDAEQVAHLCSKEYSLELFDILSFDLNQLPTDLLDEKRIFTHQALPLYVKNRKLFVAIGDPSNRSALEEFQFNAGMHTEAILVNEQQLQEVINQLFESNNAPLAMDDFDEEKLSSLELDPPISPIKQQRELDQDEQPIVKYINKMMMDAIRKGASDLHFEPFEKEYRIRFRIDGILHQIGNPPAYLASRLAARLKVMSKMDIAEKRVPQDGRIKFKISEKKSIDFRVSSLPTLFGEKIVLRILDSSIAMLGIDSLGYEPEQQAIYQANLQRSQGMILVTGPTGSGKTVSLYTGLNILNTPERNISTAEDPVEINLPGVNQVHINAKAGLDFSSALRAFLRQDPDVVMVGEIRDLETAEIAIKAAQTGHLVLSTLHTNSAAETVTRLVNMGVAGYNIASSVSLIIAQRLARRLCEHCKKIEQLSDADLEKMGFSSVQIVSQPTFYQAVGCNQCSGGYKGRVGIYETMPITENIGRIIMTGGNSIDISRVAQEEGMKNLRQSGLLKTLQGITSLAEINRVTHV